MLKYGPAIVALLLIIKLILFYFGKDSFRKTPVSRVFFLILLLVTVTNSMELLGYHYRVSLTLTVELLKVYYVSLILLFSLVFHLCTLTINYLTDTYIRVCCYLVAAVISLIVLFSDLIIGGAVWMGYSVTRVSGPYYSIFQIFAVGSLLSCISVCILGYRVGKSVYTKIQSVYILLAVISLTTPIFVTIVLMAAGIQMSAAVILPVGISIFLVIMIYTIRTEQLYDIRMCIPFTKMFKLQKALQKEHFVQKSDQQMTARERRSNHERIYLIRALMECDNNQKLVAEKLGIADSTVSKKRKDYGV